MKKTTLFGMSVIMMLLMVLAVSASSDKGMTTKAEVQIEVHDNGEIEYQYEEEGLSFKYKGNDSGYTEFEREGDQEKIRELLKLHGLENAIVHADNKTAVAVLQRNLERIQAKRAEILAKLENKSISVEDEETHVEGKKNGKFLGLLKVKKNAEYKIDAEGTVTRVPKWYDGLIPDEAKE